MPLILPTLSGSGYKYKLYYVFGTPTLEICTGTGRYRNYTGKYFSCGIILTASWYLSHWEAGSQGVLVAHDEHLTHLYHRLQLAALVPGSLQDIQVRYSSVYRTEKNRIVNPNLF